MVKIDKKTESINRLNSKRHFLERWLIRLLSLTIAIYQFLISPLLGPRCRFYPSCSEYARLAFARHGLMSGSWLTLKRLGQCHPLHRGGIDEVPESPNK